MYCTVCRWPIAIRISRSYFLVRPGHTFLKALDEDEYKGIFSEHSNDLNLILILPNPVSGREDVCK